MMKIVADDIIACFVRQRNCEKSAPKKFRSPEQFTQDVCLVIDRGCYVTFTVIGTGLTGAEWITRLEMNGYKPNNWARDIITKPDYDKKHRLEAGKEYKVTLVLGAEIRKGSERTTANLKSFASSKFSNHAVAGLKGELALLVREKFTNAELEAMGVWYVAVLHEPIIDSGGDADILRSGRSGGGSWVGAYHDRTGVQWNDGGAFAFITS